MRRVQRVLLAGGGCLLVLLGVLSTTVGLDVWGWAAGLACGAVLAGVLVHALTRGSGVVLGPAGQVTLTRGVLACASAALVVDALTGPSLGAPALATLVLLSAVGIALDAVDGRVARRTHTVSAFGARFDMEVDAFLILVLSGYVAGTTGWWWVLAIGVARYALVGARRLLPRLRGEVAPRHWCKVVAAAQGVVLTVVVAGVLPPAVAGAVLGVALLLLAESFGRETWELWRSTAAPDLVAPQLAGAGAAGVGTVADG